MDEGSLSLPPFTGHDEKSQRNYHLALRGNSLNPMIDAATPLPEPENAGAGRSSCRPQSA